MLIAARFCISGLICIAALVFCATGEIETAANKAAWKFARKWLPTPKMYVGVILPKMHLFRTRDVVKLTKMFDAELEGKTTFFIFNSNVTKYNAIPHTQNELIWYPFGIENYEMDCSFLDSSQYDRLFKKNFLFHDENRKSRNFSFSSCKVRFDSSLVMYRTKPGNKSIVEFEEIYKLDENGNNLEKNILAEMVSGGKEFLLNGLNLFIWNRRKSLKGKTFKSASKNAQQRFITVRKYRNSEGSSVIHHSGYVADIMRPLMQSLNFSLNTAALDLSYDEIVMQVGSGIYDIGYNSFTQNLLRSNYADISFGLLVPTNGLFYVKGNQAVNMEIFFNPFTSHTWILLITYAVCLICGFILAKLITRRETRLSKLKIIYETLQKGSDIVLRSLVVKRQSSEPRNCSSKISFLVLIFAGYLIFNMYRAVLVAFLATEEDNPPIENLGELMNSDYSLAVQSGTWMDTMFLNASKESYEYRLTKNGKILRFSEPTNQFLNLMVENDPKASKTILFDVYEGIRTSDHYPCKLSKIKGSTWKAGTEGMVFKKRWPWTDLFNYHLLLMRESGMMERLYKRNVKKTSKSCPGEYIINRVVREPRPVDASKTFSLYVALVIGFASSIFLLMYEKLIFRCHQMKTH